VLNGGPHGVLTAKGPARFVGGVKIREETEVDVKDVHATLDLLSQLGFQVEFTYKKHRAMWTLDGVVSVTLDTLEFGSFVELEGPLEVLPERLTIRADVAEHASEINQERAEESRKAIAERLAGQVHDDVERRSLEQELVMAEERLMLARIRRGGG